jgi:hypothetical protein
MTLGPVLKMLALPAAMLLLIMALVTDPEPLLASSRTMLHQHPFGPVRTRLRRVQH